MRELPEHKGIHNYMSTLYGRLQEDIKIARKTAAEDAARHKQLYDRRAGQLSYAREIRSWLGSMPLGDIGTNSRTDGEQTCTWW